jgi:hypothetical protein
MNEREAIILGTYLLGKPPLQKQVDRYCEACLILRLDTYITDPVTKVAFQRPYLIPYFDAALALGKEKKLLRKKILLMLAILETSTECYDDFTSKNYSLAGWLKIFLQGIQAVFKATVGKILLLFIS